MWSVYPWLEKAEREETRSVCLVVQIEDKLASFQILPIAELVRYLQNYLRASVVNRVYLLGVGMIKQQWIFVFPMPAASLLGCCTFDSHTRSCTPIHPRVEEYGSNDRLLCSPVRDLKYLFQFDATNAIHIFTAVSIVYSFPLFSRCMSFVFYRSINWGCGQCRLKKVSALSIKPAVTVDHSFCCYSRCCSVISRAENDVHWLDGHIACRRKECERQNLLGEQTKRRTQNLNMQDLATPE